VVEAGHEPPFVDDLGSRLLVAWRVGDQLEGDLALERRIPRPVDVTKPSTAYVLQNAQRPPCRPRRKVRARLPLPALPRSSYSLIISRR
jgi:hypothetical protein